MATRFAKSSRFRFRAALGVWLLFGTLVITHFLIYPSKHNSLDPSAEATRHWWQNEDIYSTPDNSGNAFFYFPQAAIFFTPVLWGPTLLGPSILRALNFALFGWGVWRSSRLLLGKEAERQFLWVTLLAIPASLASLRNGQFDLTIAAIILHAGADVAEEKWWRAVFWLWLGLALKPLTLVPMLLYWAIYRPLWFRMLVGLLVVGIVPWLVSPWPYVNWQYYRLFETFTWAYHLHEDRFSDFGSMLESAGIRPPEPAMTSIRLGASLLCLGLGWASRSRMSGQVASWFIGAMAASFLVLFNPRSEACSFVYLSPFVGALALHYLIQPGKLALRLGWALVAIAVALAADGIPGEFGPISLAHLWIKPLASTLAFLGLIYFFHESSPYKEKRKWAPIRRSVAPKYLSG